MAKAAEAFRTISEVADELNLHKHVLRFWEVKFPQIKPMKRGGGRRYYRPADMELLRGIRYLLHAEGYTIKGVQKILRERGVDAVKRFGAEVASGSEVTAGSKAPASPVAASPPAERDEISSAAPLPPRAKANPDRASDAVKSARAPEVAELPRRTPAETAQVGRTGEIAKAIVELQECRTILMGPQSTQSVDVVTTKPKHASGATK